MNYCQKSSRKQRIKELHNDNILMKARRTEATTSNNSTWTTSKKKLSLDHLSKETPHRKRYLCNLCAARIAEKR
jgi:hypothetical protein